MKLLKALLMLNIFMALVVNISALALKDEEDKNGDDHDHTDHEVTQEYSSDDIEDEELSSSQNGGSRFLREKKMKRLRCNKFPMICHFQGSPGPHCCKKKCVNVLRDGLNCGKCGKKCKYNETCCNGKCVNPSFNRSHCGGCNNRCDSGSICAFGLCNYA
ncbi:hypothetical protein Tsubulata_032548 [Turnera subulata]|uniref:Stigma-specific STIG1-like protein 1 n=1 Tax=Turnera subulata TaxID=218843 RepID=A0A9Q0JCG3_9ROSI|nr:hypothetical protein Tsubulata_032548 [Turnera subulata]